MLGRRIKAALSFISALSVLATSASAHKLFDFKGGSLSDSTTGTISKQCTGLAALDPKPGEIVKHDFERRECGPKDVFIEISYCGMCHSDYHTIKGEWGWPGGYPLVVGHEITGIVAEVGSEVSKFKVGDRVGVGCFVESCRECESCKTEKVQYCYQGCIQTYNFKHPTDKVNEITMGGYSTSITVDQDFVLKIPKEMSMDTGAPLLCAGITMWSPLVHFGVRKGRKKVGIVGFGGLGHMGVKLAKAMGNEVTVFSTSPSKQAAAEALGADFVVSKDEEAMKSLALSFDLIIDTASAPHPISGYLALLKPECTFCMVGASPEPFTDVGPFNVLANRLSLAGSLVGGIKETQEMLNFCGKHGIEADIELIPASQVNAAMEALGKYTGSTFRHVIDIKNTLSTDTQVEPL
uniref:Enoyl reductase (ER) domain-containing protein n=1 Tax=Fibrocapsa japonica TaxID=94617 RepID=A0A7S2UYE0_9STRA|mmetsp:Transcript_16742/g.24589  ORF Transcript_16742/g.24589 Transcript_16742/m.24589 type:complete len:408 (+) Transcript_16742:87-1310(+)|eukprot:CAMPEP_0113934002 /NCGR_PEP_ID=MMETSP1339-20121228/1349_1 /TAXON_ID=94617 /ORGANISM="Fibrocapsa japonica" /LENGTH=407 /DNA_ID=CAMNT_0000935603 /DNA_START=44 /DNA_END=1267 /DNA_ORIENTATION=+ /assembly_acc=CAM_ASM_000762